MVCVVPYNSTTVLTCKGTIFPNPAKLKSKKISLKNIRQDVTGRLEVEPRPGVAQFLIDG